MNKSKIFLLSFAHMCVDLNAGALPALLAFLVVTFNYSYTDAAGIMFFYSVVASIVQPVFGYISDRWSSAWYMPIAVIVISLSVGCLGFMPSYACICGAAILAGLGSALFHPEGACCVHRLAGSQKGTSMSIFSIGGNGGFALGPLVVGFIVPFCGLKGTALFAVFGILTSALLFLSFCRTPRIPSTSSCAKKETAKAENDWKSFRLLTGVVVSRSIMFQAFNAFLALYWMHSFGVSAGQGALVLTLFALTGIASNLVGGWFSDHAGYVRVLRWTQAFLLPSILVFSWLDSPWAAGILLIPIAFSLYASFSPVVILGQTYLAKNVGFASGVTMGVARSAGGIAMPVLGMIADHWGLRMAFVSMCLIALVGLWSSMKLKDERDA